MTTDIERLRVNCELLADGWREKVEYTTPVTYHREECGKPHCECPVVNEKRAHKARRPGLLEQLKDFQHHRDTDREPKSERGAPSKGKSQPPGEVHGIFTLDEITVDAYMTIDRILEDGGRDRLYASQPLREVLHGLGYQMHQIVDTRPDLVREMVRATDKWIAMARRALRHTVSDAQFADTVCGNCGGGLAVPWDNSGEVRCIGTPSEAPCGEFYPISEWVALYEKSKGRVRVPGRVPGIDG